VYDERKGLRPPKAWRGVATRDFIEIHQKRFKAFLRVTNQIFKAIIRRLTVKLNN
jgi:hypothetical protein